SSQCVATGSELRAYALRLGSVRVDLEWKNFQWKCVRPITPSARITEGGSDSRRCFFGDFLCTQQRKVTRSSAGGAEALTMTQQSELRWLVRVGRIGNPQINAGDWLDASRFRRTIELHQCEQIALIRQRQSGQFQFRRATDQVRPQRLHRIAVFRLIRQTDRR